MKASASANFAALITSSRDADSFPSSRLLYMVSRINNVSCETYAILSRIFSKLAGPSVWLLYEIVPLLGVYKDMINFSKVVFQSQINVVQNWRQMVAVAKR